MKKKLLLIAMASMVFITGCGGSEEAVETSVETTAETTEEEITTEEETTVEETEETTESETVMETVATEEIFETGPLESYDEEYWDDGTGLEGVFHKTTDPWGVNWSDYHYYEWESLYRKNGGEGNIKVVISGFVDQMMDGVISIGVNYNSRDDYNHAIAYTDNPEELERIIIYLQDGYTIDPNVMYVEGDIVTVYGTAVPNIEAEMAVGSSMQPAILAADIILEDPNAFTVLDLNEMNAYSDWENGWTDPDQ